MCPNATSAGQIPRYSYDAQAYYLPYRLKREVGSVTVEITLQKPKPSLPQPLEQSLHARAIRVCNREPRAIAQYMQVHQNLSKGR